MIYYIFSYQILFIYKLYFMNQNQKEAKKGNKKLKSKDAFRQ